MALSPSKVPGKKAGPNGSFPIGDPKHARLAIGGATRSERAGNISPSTAAHIKAEARKELGLSPGGYRREASAADRQQDAAGMKRTGMSSAQWERSAQDRREDARQSPGGYVPNPAQRKPHMHALSMAAATHLQRMGHITPAQASQIHAKARAGMNQAATPQQAQQPQAFGSLAPPMPMPMGAPPGAAGPGY